MNKIRTAILGYGRSGSTLHADPLEKLNADFTVSAVCDIDPKQQTAAQERFNCNIYDDYLKMLKQEELDLVVIVTRSDQHCQMSCDCLNAGVNVLVTKPWCVNSAEAELMIAAEKSSGKMLLPWLPARWGCDLLRLKELIATGIIGKVFMIRRREFNFGIRHDWQTQQKYGGGYLLNWGPHIVDQAIQLSGETVKSVYAQLRQVINPGDVEDTFNAQLITESGIILACEYATAINKLPNWVIQGDRGTIFVKETAIEIHQVKLSDNCDATEYRNSPEIVVTNEELTDDHRITIGNRYGDSLAVYPEIAQALKGEITYPVTTASALQLTKIFDAIKASNQTNKVITF